METPVQCAARLLIALNELVDREGMHLRSGSYRLAAEVRRRTDPLVRRLVELSNLPGVSDFRAEVMAVVEKSAVHSALLKEKMDECHAEIRRNDQARRRTAQLVPAYVRNPNGGRTRFWAAG
jgi:hypothetical protein